MMSTPAGARGGPRPGDVDGEPSRLTGNQNALADLVPEGIKFSVKSQG